MKKAHETGKTDEPSEPSLSPAQEQLVDGFVPDDEYEGAMCLSIVEVERAIKEGRDDDVLAHIARCEKCQRLVNELRANDERAERETAREHLETPQDTIGALP